jgi:hypothetical protein
VVNRLLRDERVNPAANGNAAILSTAYCGKLSVVERLLRDERVDPTTLHRRWLGHAGRREPYPDPTLTDAMLPRLAATLTLPFQATIDSPIMHWQPRLREYREKADVLKRKLTTMMMR